MLESWAACSVSLQCREVNSPSSGVGTMLTIQPDLAQAILADAALTGPGNILINFKAKKK